MNYKKILDDMVQSVDWEDRKTVAKYGYGLEQLIDDEDDDVRYEVQRQLRLRKRNKNILKKVVDK